MAVTLEAQQNPLGLTPLEIATARPFGGEAVELPRPEGDITPRRALEEALRQALLQPPCVVAFSGGRDSSAVLALAVSVARREGLEPPAAVSFGFPGRAGDEKDWQEALVTHLGLEHWERIEVQDELDLVGPVARAVLRRHGLLFPPNVHFYAPLIERARGGTLLTGNGGDEVFEGWRFHRLAEALCGRHRPNLADLRQAALWGAPRPLRRVALQRGSQEDLGWLTPVAMRRFLADRADSVASVPRRYGPALGWFLGNRRIALAVRALDLLGVSEGARVGHPLLDRHFVAELAREGGSLGRGGRELMWPRLFSDVLPPNLLHRRTKASFGDALFAAPSREFTERWSGAGLEGGIVDEAGLRATWRDRHRLRGPSLLQQALWLVYYRGQPRAEDPDDRKL